MVLLTKQVVEGLKVGRKAINTSVAWTIHRPLRILASHWQMHNAMVWR